jgi:hypothetical protein
VYCIFTSKEWVYVGESDNIQQSLFAHLNKPSLCLQQFSALSFSYELASAAERRATLGRLIEARNPACTAEERSVAR